MMSCYLAVFVKMKKESSKVAPQATNKAKYNKSAKIMSMFVVAYFIQYFGFVIQGVWYTITPAVPFMVTLSVAFFGNLGGLWNLLAYTVIRRKLTLESKSRKSTFTETSK